MDFILVSGSLTISTHLGARSEEVQIATLEYRDLRMQLLQRPDSLDFTMQVRPPRTLSWCTTGVRRASPTSASVGLSRGLFSILQTILKLIDGYHESRRCSRDTYPESYITKNTSLRRYGEFKREEMAIHIFVGRCLGCRVLGRVQGVGCRV